MVENRMQWNESDSELEVDYTSDASYQSIDETETETEEELENEHPERSAFIVYWSSLLLLLQRCLSCTSPATIKKVIVRGSALCVHLVCYNDHKHIWRSQPMQSKYYIGNLKLIAGVLFSSNTFRKLSKYFEILDIPWISKAWYYRINAKYMLGITNEAWKMEQNMIVSQSHQRELLLSGDGRCDSPGYNAKYMTYSLFDQVLNKVISVSLTQVTEVGGVSNRMEKEGLIKVLNEMKENGLNVKRLTTDRHLQIKKYMREERKDIDHQFDVWHFSKSIKTKLLNASKKKSCEKLGPWIKSICNHLWWSCATCEDSAELLKEKWTSIIFHIQNKHSWSGNFIFHKCSHPTLSKENQRSKAWLSPKSQAFEALQAIVFDKAILKDMVHLTKFSHTGILEVYHSVLNKWAPKSTHFSLRGMIARTQLAALDFNLGSPLNQAKTKDGEYKYNVTFSKATKTWSAKPIKEKKSLDIFAELVNKTVDAVLRKKSIQIPVTQTIPKNIASIPKPDKKEVIENQKSRFVAKS